MVADRRLVNETAGRPRAAVGPAERRLVAPWCAAALVLAGAWLCSGVVRAEGAVTVLVVGEAEQPATTGRIVVTVSTLEGTVRLQGTDVELRAVGDKTVLAKMVTDGAGQATFVDLTPGRYLVIASGSSFATTESPALEVLPSEVTQALLDVQLTFAAPTVEVHGASPTGSVQPVSTSDMLSGAVLGVTPLEGDDYQSLLPLLPGVVRGPDGRLRIKGGQPTQGALQISSASLVDPSGGDFELDLPGQSIASVEVLANPFAAEFGRFSSSVTQIRTRRGTNEWQVTPGNLVPRFRKSFTGIRAFEPRFSLRGPLARDQVFMAQDLQFRYVSTPVKSLPNEPEIQLASFNSFTRIDGVLSSRHTLGGGLVVFPREVQRATMSTFRPPEVTPDFNESGSSIGVVDRFSIAPSVVLETTMAGRWFEINVNTDGRAPMTYAPETQSGSFFNDQEREVSSVQLVEALSVSRNHWHGEHVFKVGIDLQHSGYQGHSTSRPLEIRRLDGSLAERTTFAGTTLQEVNGTELAVFAQDRWRIGGRLTLELGMRLDRDAVVERVNYSPRAGVAIGILPDGRGILRGGVGKFSQRTPLNVGAFPSFESRQVTRFAVDGAEIGPPVIFSNVLDGDLLTPEAMVGNVEWNQRFRRRLLIKTNYLRRHGSHEYVLQPDPLAGEHRLESTGRSRYWEFEATGRYLGGERRDLTVSYVRSSGMADLNSYDLFYGNFRNPIIRANEYSLSPTDAPHRLLVRGTFGLPGKWDVAPVLELRSGFPWSAVDEFQDFVGPRNRTGRLPSVETLDFSLSRPWRFKRHRFRAGITIHNVFGASVYRDVQGNLTSPNYGSFYNPVERSIGFVLGTAK